MNVAFIKHVSSFRQNLVLLIVPRNFCPNPFQPNLFKKGFVGYSRLSPTIDVQVAEDVHGSDKDMRKVQGSNDRSCISV